jgi:hypothetical protein
VPDRELDSYFLVDSKTGVVHQLTSYVRDFYFFHRSIHPQLALVRMDPAEAHAQMQAHAFAQKLIEVGKILLTHNALTVVHLRHFI